MPGSIGGFQRPRRESMRSFFVLLVVCALAALDESVRSQPQKDEHVVTRPKDLREDPKFISVPTLQQPIYACASSVVVKNFIPGAKLEVFVAGTATPIGSAQSWLSAGQNINVSISFTAGQVVTARQSFGGATSAPSNAVTVTTHTEDYPAGLPKPRLSPMPLLACGRAVGIADVIPGARARVFAENPISGGGFSPPVQVGSVSDFAYTFVSPAFVPGARVWAEAGICKSTSPRSDVEVVQPQPASIPGPQLDPIHDAVNVAIAWGPGGNPSPLLNGATVDVFAGNLPPGSQRIGGQPTPGGGQQVLINPAGSAGVNYWATQTLCTASPPGPTTTGLPCSKLPPAKIKAPLPGDTEVTVIDYIPGAEILVFANGLEIGHSGPPVVNLSRALKEGEIIVVLQRIGKCDSVLVFRIPVQCALGGDNGACSGDWPAFRHNGLRNAQQTQASALSNPYLVKKLRVRWQFPPAGQAALSAFRASPIVYKGRVHIGNGNGRFYTLDAATGKLLWEYPIKGAPLDSQFHSNSSSFGIASSAAIGIIKQRDAVVLGAADRSIGAGLGSGRLFALDAANGGEIWKSREIAVLNGLTAGSTTQLHEQIGYSSPLVFQGGVYVGIANHGDNPIQNGRVAAVDLANGAPLPKFNFRATGTRGGGVWSSLAGGLSGNGIYITTGNVRCWNGGCQPEPSPNHGLGLLRLSAASGSVIWKFQPVPFELDDDPDWASGPSLVSATCGPLAMSTMKDGWSYAVRAGTGTAGPPAVLWQFPPTGFPFSAGDGTTHGDSRYLVPGAIWNDVFITTTGGEEITTSTTPGFNRLHALNACAGRAERVRWVVDVPATTAGGGYRLGPPTVTRGIVYVGTHQGHLVAFADPTVWPSVGSRCSNPSVSNADCVANGFRLVPAPAILLNLPVHASNPILTEPVLAGNRVFVATTGGRVFMLEPER